MAASIRAPLRLASRRCNIISAPCSLSARAIHNTPSTPATVSPIHGSGPPPEAPQPTADSNTARIERRRKHAELLQAARELRGATSSKSSSSKSGTVSPLARKRFWKDVHVKEVDGAWEVHLDARPLRRPDTKEIVRVPLSKPLLASALALEWDLITSAQQATRQHLIPLTGLVCRALDIGDDDVRAPGERRGTGESVRETIARTVLRYLDTDSLLCWAPPRGHSSTLHLGPDDTEGDSLRDVQKRAADEVVGFLTTHVWPGVEIEPVLDPDSIFPRGQKEETRQIIEGWVMGLNEWELAGLERAVLAGKGLLGAARLVVEWSEGFVGAGVGGSSADKAFGVEEAAKVASIEVDWQTGRWGEVEDTHDVEKEDIRRQLGSVVLLVSGTGTGRR